MQFSFAKNLATVEKKVRDEAFIDMKSQLLKETELSSLEFLKLWKVLFYGYWLSDKTEVQLDLAEKISMITLDLNPTLGIEYIRYFWQTIISEWHGIDKFRIDKYYSLLRHMHFSSFKLLELNNWDPNLLASFSQMLIEGILK
ncbi:hypothetical protein HMI56_000963 [Coelomomyces lativittatus]|nr:hypothetical protein HMI56_000963 [Coelomomyces lativittatus]